MSRLTIIAGRTMTAANLLSESYRIKLRGHGAATVINPDGVEYEVDANLPSCTCPLYIFKGDRMPEGCKHIKFAREILGSVEFEQTPKAAQERG